MRPVSRCLDTRDMQSVARCLAGIYLTFDIGLRLFLEPCRTVSSYHVAVQPARCLQAETPLEGVPVDSDSSVDLCVLLCSVLYDYERRPGDVS